MVVTSVTPAAGVDGGRLENGFAFQPRHAACGFFELRQFLGELRAGIDADGAAQVHAGGALAVMVEDVKDFDARARRVAAQAAC